MLRGRAAAPGLLGFSPGLVGVGDRGGAGRSRLGRVDDVGVRFPPCPEGMRRGGSGAPGSRGDAIVDIVLFFLLS